MKVLCIILAVVSVPATFLLSNLFWTGLRETRGIAMFLSSRDFLRRIVTTDLLSRPPAEIARFAQPQSAGYAFNMTAFHEADQKAHTRGRSILRPVLLALILGSGLVGFFAFRWFGLALPIINLFVMVSTFVASTQGSIGSTAAARAAEHVQIVALILYRWYATNPQEAAEWVESESDMKLLSEVITGLRTDAGMKRVDKV
jgi:hypothetical protein